MSLKSKDQKKNYRMFPIYSMKEEAWAPEETKEELRKDTLQEILKQTKKDLRDGRSS